MEKPDLVEMARWLHDSVYNPLSSRNEEDSILLWERILTDFGMNEENIEYVMQLILTTKTGVLHSIDAQYMHDIDFSILASDFDTYHNYSKAIRKENSWYSDSDFKARRTAILKQFLVSCEKNTLFVTHEFAHCNEKAKRNIELELMELEYM